MPKNNNCEDTYSSLSVSEQEAIWNDHFPNAKTDEELEEELENC